jgi:hypothetical protein
MTEHKLEEVKRDHIVTEEEASNLDKVDDIDLLSTAFLNWHTNAINQMIHVLNMPEHIDEADKQIEISVRDPHHANADENGFRVLSINEVSAFKAGVRYAYDLVNNLPFKFVPTDADGNIKQEYQSDEPVNEQENS